MRDGVSSSALRGTLLFVVVILGFLILSSEDDSLSQAPSRSPELRRVRKIEIVDQHQGFVVKPKARCTNAQKGADQLQQKPKPEKRRKRLRVALVSLNDPGGHGVHRRSSVWMWPYTLANRRRYAELHGYDLHVEGRWAVDPATPPSWSKIKLVKKYLPFYDYVLWVDLDVLFMNFNKSVEELALKHPYDDVLVAADLNGLNAGVMLFQSTPWTSNFLDEIWHFDGDRRHIWQEQFAITELLRKSRERSLHVRFVSQHLLNAYPYTMDVSARWQPGDWLVHFANCDGRAQTCWEEFQYYFAAQMTLNQQWFTEEDLELQPPHFHYLAEVPSLA